MTASSQPSSTCPYSAFLSSTSIVLSHTSPLGYSYIPYITLESIRGGASSSKVFFRILQKTTTITKEREGREIRGKQGRARKGWRGEGKVKEKQKACNSQVKGLLVVFAGSRHSSLQNLITFHSTSLLFPFFSLFFHQVRFLHQGFPFTSPIRQNKRINQQTSSLSG